MATFSEFFRSGEPARDKYLSRLFGLFSEQVVRTWCACPEAAYQDLGRPTLCDHGQTRGHTLDFTFQRRDSSRRYVGELKCELEYDGYRYLTLRHGDQVRHHRSVAFGKFLAVTRDPDALLVRRAGQVEGVEGGILVWGALTPEGRAMAMAHFGFADVLSVEGMVSDLQTWAPDSWGSLTRRYRSWTTELFDFLAGPMGPATAAGEGGGR